MRSIIINTDGASKGNPGDAGIGVVITTADGKRIKEVAEYIGKATNNVAEYSALIIALKEAKSLKADIIDVRTDSELMVHQINGIYKVKSQLLKPFYEEVMHLLRGFHNYRVSHVFRDKNKRADELANEGITKYKTALKPEIESQEQVKETEPTLVDGQITLEF